MKKIKGILAQPGQAGMVGDGFRVYNYFPNGYHIRHEMSPFLMLDYNPAFTFGPTTKPRGVDVHPHRGFETVTIAWKGAISHHDSAGNSGTIYPGDVQWMTAASGILHKEYHEKEFARNGGEFQMAQLWINLPKKDKMSAPKYQGITAEQIPNAALENNGGTVRVIAGDYNGQKGAASTFTPINVWDIRLHAGGKLETKIPASHNTGILVIQGSIGVNGQEAHTNDFVLFAAQGEEINITTTEETILLLLSGEPISEPVAHYGPFVMNTQQELVEAIDDFNNGKFGYLD